MLLIYLMRTFLISALEARQMDPQHRLLLEVTWNALEDAALALQKINKQKVGVYIGSSSTDYKSLITQNNNETDFDPDLFWIMPPASWLGALLII